MSNLAENVESIHQGTTSYALETLVQQCSRSSGLNVSFRQTLSAITTAEEEYDGPLKLRSKAQCYELYDVDFEFPQNNMISAASELESLCCPVPEIIKMLEEIMTPEVAQPTEPPFGPTVALRGAAPRLHETPSRLFSAPVRSDGRPAAVAPRCVADPTGKRKYQPGRGDAPYRA